MKPINGVIIGCDMFLIATVEQMDLLLAGSHVDISVEPGKADGVYRGRSMMVFEAIDSDTAGDREATVYVTHVLSHKKVFGGRNDVITVRVEPV